MLISREIWSTVLPKRDVKVKKMQFLVKLEGCIPIPWRFRCSSASPNLETSGEDSLSLLVVILRNEEDGQQKFVLLVPILIAKDGFKFRRLTLLLLTPPFSGLLFRAFHLETRLSTLSNPTLSFHAATLPLGRSRILLEHFRRRILSPRPAYF